MDSVCRVYRPRDPRKTALWDLLDTLSPGLSGPIGPQGPTGPQGPEGPIGLGLGPGSYLFLTPGMPPPDGFQLLGTTDFKLDLANKKSTSVEVNVYWMPDMLPPEP